MSKIYKLQPDIFAKYVPKISVQLDDNVSFIDGEIIKESMPSPLIFTTRHSVKEPPLGLHCRVIPVMSDEFIKALQTTGVSNLQCFPAEIRSIVDGSVWPNYQAVNILGKISCANLESSEFTQIFDRPEDDALPLMAFEDLELNPERAHGALLFRLAESPGIILIAERVVKYLRSLKSDDNWGITIDET